MYEIPEENLFNSAEGIELGSGEEEPIVCFRCGLCCTYYRVLLSLEEAQRIVNYTGLPLTDFIEQFDSRLWLEEKSLLLRQQNGACFFLEHVPDRKEWLCRIHQVKPSACREWMPGLYRRECQRGLAEYWNLIITPAGQLHGTEEDLSSLRSFLDSLESGEEKAGS